MTLEELKKTPNLQERLQAVVKEVYNVSYPVSDLVRRAALKPDLLQLDKYEKPLYSVCVFVKCQWVKEILDEIAADYEKNPNVQRYIISYFKSKGITEKEDLQKAMQNSIAALPMYLQEEETCKNFKVCKFIELAQRDEGKFADVTDALMGNREAVIDYGGEMEDLIDEGVPIDVANRVASQNTARRFKFAETLVAPVRMTYQIRDSIEESIAEGLGEYGDQYRENRQAIRERKEELKQAKLEAKREAELNKIRNPQQRQGRGVNAGYGSSYGSGMYGNSYGGSMYGQRGGLFGRRGYGGTMRNGMGYGGYGGMRRGAFGLPQVAIVFSLLTGLIGIIACLVMRRGFINFGSIVWIVGFVLNILSIIKRSMNERGWPVLCIFGILLSLAGLFLLFKF